MALITADRVKETSTTTGTGTLTLAGAVNGFKSFADIGNGNQCYYAIVGVAVPSEWEVGIGTYTASGTTLSRDTVLRSSTGSKVSFSAGTKEVFVTYPADHSLSQADVGTAPNQVPLNQYLGSMAYEDNDSVNIVSGQISTITNNPTLSAGVANAVAYLNASKVLTTGSALTFDGSNLGVGVLPNNWYLWKAFEIGTLGNAVATGGTADLSLFTNTKLTAAYSYQYANNGAATRYNQNAGAHYWFIAPSGTAGNAITFTQAMTLNASGNLGIGTATPDSKLQVFSSSGATSGTFTDGVNSTLRIAHKTGSVLGLAVGTGQNLAFGLQDTSGGELTERMRVNSSGSLLIGTTSTTNNIRLSQKLSLVTAGTTSYGGMSIANYGNANGDIQGLIDLNRSRGTTDGAMTVVQNGDSLGAISWRGADGTNFITSANIKTEVDGTPGSNDMPGRLVFSTTADGAASPTERMRIDSAGNIGIATTAPTAKLDVNSDVVRVRTAKTPASATDTGNAGDICWDSNYVYVCVATNTWKRSAIATW